MARAQTKNTNTSTLNGCTLVHSGNVAAPSVGHANFVDPVTTLADQNAVDADLLLKFGAMPANRLIKTNYKRQAIGLEDYRATVIGIHRGTVWRFHYQDYQVESEGNGRLTSTGLDMCHEI